MTEEKRKQNPRSPFANRRNGGSFKPRQVEPSRRKVVVNHEELAAFDAMCAARPMKPPPCTFGPPKSHAARTSAAKDRLGIVVVRRRA